MPKPPGRRQFLKTAAILTTGSNGLLAAPRSNSHDWTHYGGDQEATRYSPLAQITSANVRQLEVAWVHHSAAEGSRYRGSVECTPLVIGGVMFIVGADLVVQALNASTGKLVWSYAPIPAGARRASGVSRGLTYWKEGKDERIFAPIQSRIWCLNALTGQPIESFGEKGSIDIEKDVDRDMTGLSLASTTPGAIYKHTLIVTTRTEEGPRPAAPGHIRAYDVLTGKRRWIFHTIPHPGEFGYDTWSPNAWKTTGGANCWGGMSVDEKRGLVFVSTGSPTFDFYGGDRVGKNLFGNSIIALKAETGERVWHFQTVHHDIWDYDIPCQPTLATITHQGRRVDILAQVSKTGWVYLFERATGKPIHPIEERPVPKSDIPGEQTFPTQPFPTNPPPFSRQGISPADLTNISPEAAAYVREQLKDFQFGPMFTPPGRRETIVLPGFHGGALWGGASFDPKSQWLYVNHNEIPWSTAMSEARQDAGYRFDFSGYHRNVDKEGYPVIRPPWGQISAIDLKNSKIVWQSPHGEFKKLTARGVPRTGTYIRGGNIATAGGVLFSAGTLDSVFRAYDAKAGKVLWEKYLGGGAFATPSTYMVDGRQFVVVPVSDDLNPEEPSQPGPYRIGDFVAFALPQGMTMRGLIPFLAAALYAWPQQAPPPPEQPIPFSHKTHASLSVKCTDCHTIKPPGDKAGLPAESTCMACHTTVKKESPAIQKLAFFAQEKKNVPWVRVYKLPKTVYFSHEIHYRQAKADCATCHGPIAEREAVALEKSIRMTECMACHDRHKASNKCDLCHDSH